MTDNLQTRGEVLTIIEGGPDGEPTAASLEAVGAARIIAEALGGGLEAAVSGSKVSHREMLGDRGVGRLYELSCSASGLADTAWAASQQSHPMAVVMPATPGGRAAAGTLSARTGSELVSGCTLISLRDGVLHFGRPCLSGRGFALFAWDRSSPVVLTAEPGAFRAPAPTAAQQLEVVTLDVPVQGDRKGVTVLDEVAPSPEEMDVADADVVVAGGAGVGDKEGFTLLTELARKLGGTVAASRVAVDRGWLPSSRQVGLTGKTISPRVYLAFGISGAPQHIAGIRSAGKVVAINTDAKAPILKMADLAVIADLHEVVPMLIERLATNGAPGREG